MKRETPETPLGQEGGFALIGALLVMVLVSALGGAAIFRSRLDLMLAGNYRVQRTAEASADGALDLVKAMVLNNAPQLTLPLGIPATDAAATAWVRTVSYSDPDIDVAFTIKYKREDNINYNTGEAYPDEVVRYGKDYNYQSAQKVIGKQPVYTATFTDNRTGVKGEADLISTIGFNTPAALFCGGVVHMQKYAWATEETVEVTAGSGTPAVATASTNVADITIETVRENTVFTGATTLAAAAVAGDATITVTNNATYNTTGFPAAGQLLLGSSLVTYTAKTATQFAGCTGVPAAAVGTFVNVASLGANPSYNAVNPTSTNQYAVGPSYLHRRVYRPSEVEGSKNAGLYNQARESAHILLGVGDRLADLDIAYTAAGGGAPGAGAANSLFRFYNRTVDGLAGGYDLPVAFDNSVTPHLCSGIVCYNFQMPTAQAPLTQLETMFGQSFTDLKSLADQVFTCTSTVNLPTGGTSNYGCNLSGVNLGSAAAPQVVYFNGTGTGNKVALVTDAGTQVTGFGILVIDGDPGADIIGSLNWRGLMLIKGNLLFRPWQGGTQALRSGPELSTTWNGFIIIGNDLDLWTYWGGSIILGYSSSDVAAIKGIIASTVPHKVLSWRRAYN